MIKYDDSQYNHQEEELLAEFPKIKEKVANITSRGKEEGYDFLFLPEDVLNQAKVVEAGQEIKRRFETVLVVGIGGSDLGARAVAEALLHPFHNFLPKEKRPGLRLLFLGDTLDPDEVKSVTETIDWKSTVVVPISKSGGTLEPMAILHYVLPKLPSKDNILAITQNNGFLAEIAKKLGWWTLPALPTVGGRFSVLSPNGLFPLFCAGIDIKALTAGAGNVIKLFKTESITHPSIRFALHHYIANIKYDQNMAVLAPYANRLEGIGRWWRQLWAESLGKKGQGQTPVVSVMPRDQHSQLQLYADGPNDKIFTFLTPARPRRDEILPGNPPPEFRFLSNRPLFEVQKALWQGTATALAEKGRSIGRLILDQIDEESLGALIMMLEIATALSGNLYGINPFDQPAVERSKQVTKEILEKETS